MLMTMHGEEAHFCCRGDCINTKIKKGAIFVTDDRPVRPLSPSTNLASKFLRDYGPVLVAEANEYPSVYGTLEDAEQCLAAGLRAEADDERVVSGDVIQYERMFKVRIVVERTNTV